MMNEEQQKKYNDAIEEINITLETNPQKIHDMLKEGKCPVPTECLLDIPLGMFHCELCGTMVIAGIPHGPVDPEWHPEANILCKYFCEDYNVE